MENYGGTAPEYGGLKIARISDNFGGGIKIYVWRGDGSTGAKNMKITENVIERHRVRYFRATRVATPVT